MRVADEGIVLEIKESVIVYGIRGCVKCFVKDKGVDGGLAGENDVVPCDPLCRQFRDPKNLLALPTAKVRDDIYLLLHMDIIDKRLSLLELPLSNQDIQMLHSNRQ